MVSDETFSKRVKGHMLANAAKGRTRVQERHHEQEGLSLVTKENFQAGRHLGSQNWNHGKK